MQVAYAHENSVDQQAAARAAQVATTMEAALPELARNIHGELAEVIPELRGDTMILELLRASTVSNIENFLHVAQYGIAIEDVQPPAAAVEYARRLAQRGISVNALMRAYRLGQKRVLDWAFEEIAREESNGQVAFVATHLLQTATFAYVDKVAELVAVEYESERESWLANRNTVRATTLAAVLAGRDVDVATGEAALGYRLRQHHLGVVVWATDQDDSTSALRRLEDLVAAVGDAVGGVRQPLFIPRDRSIGWGWIPLGRSVTDPDERLPATILTPEVDNLRVALGTPGAAMSGFRSTHAEALRAHAVATIAAEHADPVTTYGEPGVRAAALLARDLDAARDLVASSLGPLAADDDGAAHLRDTLLSFLTAKGSYLATAEQLHVHKNTVKYRVDKAVELRGRPVDEDRFNLELALVACRWLGTAVLAHG